MNKETRDLIAAENANALHATEDRLLRLDLLEPLMRDWAPLDRQRREMLLGRQRILPFRAKQKREEREQRPAS